MLSAPVPLTPATVRGWQAHRAEGDRQLAAETGCTPGPPWFNVRFHAAPVPIGIQPFQMLQKPGLQPRRRVRSRHRHVEANDRMYPGPAHIVLDGGSPEQVNPLPRIGIKGTPVTRTRLGQIALKVGLKCRYKQVLPKRRGLARKAYCVCKWDPSPPAGTNSLRKWPVLSTYNPPSRRMGLNSDRPGCKEGSFMFSE